MDENVRVNERLLANGTVTPEAVLRSRAERSEVVQQLADAEQRASAALRSFNLLLDRPLDASVELLSDSALALVVEGWVLDVLLYIGLAMTLAATARYLQDGVRELRKASTST